MNRFCVIVSLLLTFFVSTIKADGLYVGFCDGNIGTNATGISGSNVVISEAVFLRPVDLASYRDQSIFAIHAGLCPSSSSFPDSITVWVRATRDGENLASAQAPAVSGWNLVDLDHSVALNKYDTTGLWIGFSFFQPSKKNVIAFTANQNGLSDCGWIAKGNTWFNKSTSNGVLPIEALVEGEGLPLHNISIVRAAAVPDIVKLGENIKYQAVVRNNAAIKAENAVLSVSIADKDLRAETKISELSYRQEAAVSLSLPSTSFTEEGEVIAKFTLTWGDGSTDDYVADNEAEAVVTLSKEVFYKTVLVEEGTGAWCGWCVRGLVGMKNMRERYPERFIGIGVHNGDDYTVSNYDSWMSGKIKGYPSCIIDRDGNVYDPGTQVLEDYYKSAEQVAVGGIGVSAVLNGSTLTFEGDVAFSKNISNPDYKVAYVVVEDKLPIVQSNYYSGGSYGEMGGFEAMASKVKVDIDDVARGVYPSPNGTEFTLPAEVVRNEHYTHTLEAQAPTIADINNAFVVAILIDGSTGKVVNASKGQITVSTDIHAVESTDAASETYYNLMGQPVSASQKGLVIRNGKKLVRF